MAPDDLMEILLMILLICGGLYLLTGLIVALDLEIRARRVRPCPPGWGIYLVVIPMFVLLWPLICLHPLTRRWGR